MWKSLPGWVALSRRHAEMVQRVPLLVGEEHDLVAAWETVWASARAGQRVVSVLRADVVCGCRERGGSAASSSVARAATTVHIAWAPNATVPSATGLRQRRLAALATKAAPCG